MSYLVVLLLLLAGFSMGTLGLLAYIVVRMMRNEGWDDSNLTNALRLLSHVCLHPKDFGKMYYLNERQMRDIYLTGTDEPIRPFWYVSKDELSEVVKTRP